MNQRLKTLLLFLIEPRSIILLVALFNFIVIWSVAKQRAMLGITCAACPWYFPWYWDNEPTQLLIAAILLRLNRFLGSVIALLITGHLLGIVGYYFAVHPDSFHYHWLFLRTAASEPFHVLSWHGQYLFALIILCYSICYLTRTILRRKVLQRMADNKSLDRSAGRVCARLEADDTCSVGGAPL
jgi:hypothetical protein